MFDFRKKNQPDFGFVSVSDDRDIEVVRLRRESRQGLWSEGFKLLRDVFLIIVVFILFGVFFVQPVVVEGTSMLPQRTSRSIPFSRHGSSVAAAAGASASSGASNRGASGQRLFMAVRARSLR